MVYCHNLDTSEEVRSAYLQPQATEFKTCKRLFFSFGTESFFKNNITEFTTFDVLYKKWEKLKFCAYRVPFLTLISGVSRKHQNYGIYSTMKKKKKLLEKQNKKQKQKTNEQKPKTRHFIKNSHCDNLNSTVI